MPDPDRDAEPERTVDPKYDNWPIQQHDAYTSWSVERKTPGEGDRGGEPASDDVEWIGFAGAANGAPFLYDPRRSAVYEGELDEENERILVGDERGGRAVESTDSLGAHIEEIGEEHGWTWLSSFARNHLEDENRTGGGRSSEELELRRTEFDRRNVAESAPYDISFFGSHTFVDESDRVHVVEREFAVPSDGPGGGDGAVTVEVDEEYLVAEEPREDERAGDADLVDERNYELEADVDPHDPAPEAELERYLNEWHSDHPGLRTGE